MILLVTSKTLPTVILCVAGRIHLIYSIWCVRSLKRFGYGAIEIAVSSCREKLFFQKYFPDVPCNVVSVNIGEYPNFSYKPFALKKYLEEIGIQHQNRDIVICDADILWRKDPAPLFKRFSGCNWVHKITAVDPADYELEQTEIPKSNIGLRTIRYFNDRYGIPIYPKFNLNAGLFMLPESVFPNLLDKWFEKINALPPGEMLMSEALMALTYVELELTPTSDRSDIKYFGRHDNEVSDRLSFSLDCVDKVPGGMFSGYQTAKHYYGDQRWMLHRDAVDMGIDSDRLATEVVLRTIVRKFLRVLRSPSLLMRRLTSKLCSRASF